MTDQDRDLVEAEWNLICPMEPLYAGVESLEPLHDQAVQMLDVTVGPYDSGSSVSKWIDAEAARRVASALAMLCYGGNWDTSPSNAPIGQGNMPRRS